MIHPTDNRGISIACARNRNRKGAARLTLDYAHTSKSQPFHVFRDSDNWLEAKQFAAIPPHTDFEAAARMTIRLLVSI